MTSSTVEHVKQAADLWTATTTLVAAGVSIVAFIEGVGGWTQFLVEVGVYGVACYVAAIVVLPLLVLAMERLSSAFARETTDRAAGIAVGVALLGGGALLRFGVLDPGVARDLDAIGTAFLALLGVAVLAIPLVVLWYFKGSTPRANGASRPSA